MMEVERKCINCTYYPCLRINCGKVCDNHKFEHEKLMKEIDKKLQIKQTVKIIKEEGYQDWEGMR